MKNYELFEQVRNLFNTQNEAFDIFYTLKHHSSFNLDDKKKTYLYICPNEGAVKRCFNEIVNELKHHRNYIIRSLNHDTNVLICNNEETREIITYRVYAINRLAHGIDGIRATNIRFCE